MWHSFPFLLLFSHPLQQKIKQNVNDHCTKLLNRNLYNIIAHTQTDVRAHAYTHKVRVVVEGGNVWAEVWWFKDTPMEVTPPPPPPPPPPGSLANAHQISDWILCAPACYSWHTIETGLSSQGKVKTKARDSHSPVNSSVLAHKHSDTHTFTHIQPNVRSLKKNWPGRIITRHSKGCLSGPEIYWQMVLASLQWPLHDFTHLHAHIHTHTSAHTHTHEWYTHTHTHHTSFNARTYTVVAKI